METLEGEKPQDEVVEPTQEEGAKPTPPKVEPTVSITETEEFRHELDKAVGKSTASLQQQVTISKQATQAALAQHEALKAAQAKASEDIRFLEQRLESLADERFADDPEAIRGFKNTLALELRERKATAKDEALKLVEAEQEGFRQAYLMGEASLGLKKKYQVPGGILEACTSVEQMETIAKAFPEVEEAEKKEKTPKFDSLTPSGVGVALEGMSARELIQHHISKRKK